MCLNAWVVICNVLRQQNKNLLKRKKMKVEQLRPIDRGNIQEHFESTMNKGGTSIQICS